MGLSRVKKSRSISLTELAALARVSKSTVSRALQDHPRISTEVKTKIVQLAEQYQYQPQPLLSRVLSEVRQNRAKMTPPVIAYLDGGKSVDDIIKYPTIRKFFRGANLHCQQHGYRLEYFWIGDPTLTPPRLLKILRTQKITTALVRFATQNTELISRWLETLAKDLNLITVGFQYPGLGLAFAMNDQTQTARLALTQMIQQGYQRIGAIMNRSTEEMIDYRFYGSYHAIRAKNQSVLLSEPFLINHGHETDEDEKNSHLGHSASTGCDFIFKSRYLFTIPTTLPSANPTRLWLCYSGSA
jgi:LacI family transcriptional regulator